MLREFSDRVLPNPRRDRRENRLLGVIAAFVTIIIAIGWTQLAFSRPVPIVPAGQTFTCTPIAVWDGDGPIWCKEGPRIRLAGIAARELDNTCRRGHPCPAAGGIVARDTLVNLLGGPIGTSRSGHILVHAPSFTCQSTGHAKGVRTAARCRNHEVDLASRLIEMQVALPW